MAEWWAHQSGGRFPVPDLWTGRAGESWASGCPSLSLPSAFLEDLKWTDSGLPPLSSGICRTLETGCAAVRDDTLAA